MTDQFHWMTTYYYHSLPEYKLYVITVIMVYTSFDNVHLINNYSCDAFFLARVIDLYKISMRLSYRFVKIFYYVNEMNSVNVKNQETGVDNFIYLKFNASNVLPRPWFPRCLTMWFHVQRNKKKKCLENKYMYMEYFWNKIDFHNMSKGIFYLYDKCFHK